jgi:uncharacterized membrane protein YhaH (DUF805 family)
MGGSRRRGAGEGVLAVYWVVFGLWVVASIGFQVAFVMTQIVLGDWCSDPETSAAGKAHWSWTELGKVCTFNGTDGPHETGPGMGIWTILIALAAVGAALLLAGRWLRNTRRHGADSLRLEPTSAPAANQSA